MSVKLGGFTITFLSPTNYEPWRKTVSAYFQLAGLRKFLLGTATVSDYGSAAEYEAKADDARSNLVLCIGFAMLAQVYETDSAKDIWDRLEQYYRPKGFGANLSYFAAFLTKRFVYGRHTGQSWCSEIDSEVVRLKALGITITDFTIVYVLLTGLGPDWEVFITTLDAADKNATKPEYVKRRIMNEWAKRESHADPEDIERTEDRAMAANHARHRLPLARSRASPTPTTARRPPARPSSDPPRRVAINSNPDCHRCSLIGHIAANCDIHLDGDRYMTEDEVASLGFRGVATAAAKGNDDDEDDDGEDDDVVAFSF